MCIATAAVLNKQVQNEPMKICVTLGLAKSELLSEVVLYLVRVIMSMKGIFRLSRAINSLANNLILRKFELLQNCMHVSSNPAR